MTLSRLLNRLFPAPGPGPGDLARLQAAQDRARALEYARAIRARHDITHLRL